MDKSSRLDIPLGEQGPSWDAWHQRVQDRAWRAAPRVRQWERLEQRLRALQRTDLAIVDVGCGAGWTCERMVPYGAVTGTDLAAQTLEEAAARVPGARFLAGNIFDVDLPVRTFDVAVSLEVLSHITDQPAFVTRLADLLTTGGRLFLATQNRPVYEHSSQIRGPIPGTIRHWVDHRALRRLLEPHFADVEIESACPGGDQGILRVVNSVRLNRLARKVFSESAIEAWKERRMWGQSLMAWAIKRG